MIRQMPEEEREKIGKKLTEKKIEELAKNADWSTSCFFIATAEKTELQELANDLKMDVHVLEKIRTDILEERKKPAVHKAPPLPDESDDKETKEKDNFVPTLSRYKTKTAETQLYLMPKLFREMIKKPYNPKKEWYMYNTVQKTPQSEEQNVYWMMKVPDEVNLPTGITQFHLSVARGIDNCLLAGEHKLTIEKIIQTVKMIEPDTPINEEEKIFYEKAIEDLHNCT